MVQDPVCQMKFSLREAKVTTQYKGKLYYFCSPSCRDTFIDQSDLYLKKVSSMFLTIGVMGSAGNETTDDVNRQNATLYTEHHYKRPSCFCDAIPAGTG